MSLKVSKLFRFLRNVVELKIIQLFQASKGRDQVEFDGISDLPASDNESMNTADKPSLDRQGSIQVNYKITGESLQKGFLKPDQLR
jgi:hypothetical protein